MLYYEHPDFDYEYDYKDACTCCHEHECDKEEALEELNAIIEILYSPACKGFDEIIDHIEALKKHLSN
jgi:hypothetical protein